MPEKSQSEEKSLKNRRFQSFRPETGFFRKKQLFVAAENALKYRKV
jgi:hypothetical protein